MFSVFKNAWKLPELRKKILYTLLMLLLYRLCCYIPTPGIDPTIITTGISSANENIWGLMNIITGGSLQGYTFMAMGISPYINASIIIQLLAVVFPKLGELAKNDKKTMNFITRIVTVVLAVVLSIVPVIAIYKIDTSEKIK